MKSAFQDSKTIFDRYEDIRRRLPVSQGAGRGQAIVSLTEIADQVDTFVFDAFGVLNVGESAIPGAIERLDELRGMGRAIRVLTNAASYDKPGAIAKFKRLGFRLKDDEIITSREAALRDLPTRLWGVIAAEGDRLPEIDDQTLILADDPADYDSAEAILFLSTADWSHDRQALLEASLKNHPRPVRIANADLVAPRDDGFTLEPGYFGHHIADLTGAPVEFFGKPFPHVFQMVQDSLPDVPPERIAMCGDSLHTDILGAAAAGWQSVLVTADGLFAGEDVGGYIDQSGLHPDWILPRI